MRAVRYNEHYGGAICQQLADGGHRNETSDDGNNTALQTTKTAKTTA